MMYSKYSLNPFTLLERLVTSPRSGDLNEELTHPGVAYAVEALVTLVFLKFTSM